MARELEADGNRWTVSLAERKPHAGVSAIVFYCENNQRPYRVAEVPSARIGGDDAIDALDAEELRKIFDSANTMDYVHEKKADPEKGDGVENGERHT